MGLPVSLPATFGGGGANTTTGGLTVSVEASGSLLLGIANPPRVVRPGPPANELIDTDHVVALRTVDGIQLHEFGPRQYTTLKWGRELRDVSSCEVTLPPLLDLHDKLPQIYPWLHWISVFTRQGLVWDGPIQKLSTTRDSATITAKDIGAYMTRTRSPMTKRWDSSDVSVPAGELWQAMIDAHHLAAAPIIRTDPQGQRYDFAVKSDEKMMDGPIGDLVNMGLRWTVVAGVPIIGPVGLRPVAELGEHDFVGGGIELIRDGSQFFNDVLLRGPDSLAHSHIDRHGLNLQTIVEIESMFGVSNVERATGSYARWVSDVRDAIGLADGSVLHPNAPVSLDDLIPSTRFSLSAYGLRSKQELESMSVSLTSGRAEVGIKLESVIDKDDLPELQDIIDQKSVGATV